VQAPADTSSSEKRTTIDTRMWSGVTNAIRSNNQRYLGVMLGIFDANATGPTGESLLNHALSQRPPNLGVVKWLVEHGAARVLCFKLPADNNNGHSLYVGYHYESKGLHRTETVKRLTANSIKINSPIPPAAPETQSTDSNDEGSSTTSGPPSGS